MFGGSRNTWQVFAKDYGPLTTDEAKRLAGDHTHVATPVPIPNTAVKHLGSMIVRIARK